MNELHFNKVKSALTDSQLEVFPSLLTITVKT